MTAGDTVQHAASGLSRRHGLGDPRPIVMADGNDSWRLGVYTILHKKFDEVAKGKTSVRCFLASQIVSTAQAKRQLTVTADKGAAAPES